MSKQLYLYWVEAELFGKTSPFGQYAAVSHVAFLKPKNSAVVGKSSVK